MASQQQQTFTVADLRSHSLDYKRDHETKQKWARGEAWGPGRLGSTHARPAKLVPKEKRSNREMGVNAHKLTLRHAISDGDDYMDSDSSAEEELEEPSAVDVAYSYDAATGPSQGSQVLTFAINQAVERYENTVTDKIVQTEYELLDNTGDVIPAKVSKKAASREDDEFVFV